MNTKTPHKLEPLFYTEGEVAQLLGVHRSTVRYLAMQKGTDLNRIVVYLSPSTRRYPREAIHRLADFVRG